MLVAGNTFTQEGKTFIILKVNKKTVSLREVIVKKSKNGTKITFGDFYTADKIQ